MLIDVSSSTGKTRRVNGTTAAVREWRPCRWSGRCCFVNRNCMFKDTYDTVTYTNPWACTGGRYFRVCVTRRWHVRSLDKWGRSWWDNGELTAREDNWRNDAETSIKSVEMILVFPSFCIEAFFDKTNSDFYHLKEGIIIYLSIWRSQEWNMIGIHTYTNMVIYLF